MKVTYYIQPINITSVVTDESISDVPCNGCTMCCEILSPYLTPDEISSGKYPISLVQPTPEQLRDNPNIGPTVTMFKNAQGGCAMFIDNRCSIYDYRPISCRQFDCRKGHHPKIPNMIDK